MGKISEAQRLHKKIKHYHEHAGSRGHFQARDHFNALSDLMFRANRSQKHKNDVPIIHGIYKSAKQMMDEMKGRAASDDSK